MLDRIRAWVTSGSSDGAGLGSDASAMYLAAAGLLAEAAQEDGSVSEDEAKLIRSLLAERFSLSAPAAAALAERGEAAQANATGLFRFSRASVGTMDEGQREQLVEMMWDVIYADGVVHEYEANLMRRICGLLHVSDRASGEARKRAERRRAGSPG